MSSETTLPLCKLCEKPPHDLGDDCFHCTGSCNMSNAILTHDEWRKLMAVPAPAPEGVKYGCYCDLEPGQSPDGCVIDEGKPLGCVYATIGGRKERCPYWRPIEGKKPAPAQDVEGVVIPVCKIDGRNTVESAHVEVPSEWTASAWPSGCWRTSSEQPINRMVSCGMGTGQQASSTGNNATLALDRQGCHQQRSASTRLGLRKGLRAGACVQEGGLGR